MYGKRPIWLSKWAINGTLLWVKTLGGPANDVGTSVQQTSDGGYIVTGYTGGDNDVFEMEADCLIAKCTADGTLSWAKALKGTGHDVGASVQQTSDGGYIVAGSTWGFDRRPTGMTILLTKCMY